MGRIYSFITLLGIFSSALSLGASFGASGCEGEFANETWTELVTQEPRLEQELGNIAKASGQVNNHVVQLTNCRIEWPVNEKNEPIEGFRTAVLHHVWYTKNAQGESVRNEGGMRLVWNTAYKDVYVGSEIIMQPVRDLKGFTICQSPVACTTLNVLGLKEGQGTPVGLTRTATNR